MKDIFMIGSTHFDPVWTWTWEEGMLSIHSTFRSALDRMKEDPDFIYSFATPPVFEWIREIDPAMFDEIKERVKEGRWELCEGWWVQPDTFSGCGESYARQSLYGQQYLMDNFGMYSRSVFNIDSFGHNSQTPQILKKSHMDFYCMCRPEDYFFSIKCPYFLWRGKDGSEVRTFRIGQRSDIYPYDTGKNIEKAESNMQEAEFDELMTFGVTNHGGAPTKEAIATIRKMDAEKDYSIRFASVVDYFEAQEEPTSVVTTEMLTKNFGPYVNDRQVKTLNRMAEYAVLNAEKASLMANKLLNRDYQGETLALCWKDILFNTFHDILGGANFVEGCFDARIQLDRAIYTAKEMRIFKLHAITKQIKTPGKNGENAWNLIAWNLNETPYDGYLEGELQWLHEFPAYSGEIVLEDETGKQYDCQIILENSVIPGFRSRVLFRAEIPAMGYKMFEVIKTGKDVDKTKTHKLSLETDSFSVQVDETTGLISSIYAKKTGKTYTELLKPQCFDDPADAECFSHTKYGEPLEAFQLIDIETTESGNARNTLKVRYAFRKSFLTLYYTFYQDTDYFDVKYVVNWNEDHIALKLLSKTGYENVIASSPYATEERADTEADVPVGEWLSSYGEDGGVSFMFDSTFGYNKTGDTLGLTVLRSCIYTDLRLGEELPKEDYPVMEQGISEGKLRIMIHKGTCFENKVFDLARAINNPPVVLSEPNHDGVYPSEASFISLESKSVVLGAAKKAEKEDADIVRLAEIAGKAQEVKFHYFDQTLTLSMKPYEIKTVRIKGDDIREVLITED